MAEQDPFISVADLEAMLGETIANPNSLIVKISLDSACESVRSYLDQVVNYVANDVEIHSGSGKKKMRLRQRPVRAVDQIIYRDETDPIDPSNYSVRGQIVTLIDGSFWDSGNDNVFVTYDHGWDIAEASDWNVPADIRLVALLAARRVYEAVGYTPATSGGDIVREQMGEYSYELSEASMATVSSASGLVGPEKIVLDRYRIELVGDTPTQ